MSSNGLAPARRPRRVLLLSARERVGHYESKRPEPPRESWRLWGVLSSVESDSWTHAAVVGWCRTSNSTGVSIPRDECRRCRL
jgi:hypothetical protein